MAGSKSKYRKMGQRSGVWARYLGGALPQAPRRIASSMRSCWLTRPARVYYRLRQVDRDGTAHFSPVRVVTREAAKKAGFEFVVYPTHLASGEKLHYALSATLAPQAGSAELEVWSATGQRLLGQRLAAGATGILALPALPAGWYLVRLRLPDGRGHSGYFVVY